MRAAERARARVQADKIMLAAQLAAQRRQAAVVAEAADTGSIEQRLAARGAEDVQEMVERLHAGKAAVLAAKAAAQHVLLERDEELCGLYERSATLQQEMDAGAGGLLRAGGGGGYGGSVLSWLSSCPCAFLYCAELPGTPHTLSPPLLTSLPAGTVVLQHCDDDMRQLQLEVGELQRRLYATHKTAPDGATYDRQIATLKADVLRARREADIFGAALEDPSACPDRCRVLPGRLPGREGAEGGVEVLTAI